MIEFKKIEKSLLKLLYSPIPDRSLSESIKILTKISENRFYVLCPYSEDEYYREHIDDIAAIFMAIRSSFSRKNIVRQKNGIFYLNLQNGIFAKFIIRENKDNLEEDILLIGEKTELDRDWQKWDYNTHRTKMIFSGHSSSGFLMNIGLYAITKEIIFEIYFEASAFLLNSNQYISVQTISDSRKKDNEYYSKEFIDDDDW